MARVTRGCKLGKTMDIVSQDPVATELLVAVRLVLLSATYIAMQTGMLDSLML